MPRMSTSPVTDEGEGIAAVVWLIVDAEVLSIGGFVVRVGLDIQGAAVASDKTVSDWSPRFSTASRIRSISFVMRGRATTCTYLVDHSPTPFRLFDGQCRPAKSILDLEANDLITFQRLNLVCGNW